MTEHRGILTFAADIPPEFEHDFNRWYEEEHIPERLAIPGFLRACRYRAVTGGPRYLAVYEVTSPQVFETPEYLHFLKGAGETQWTQRVLAACTSKSRVIYEKISERKA